MTAALIEDHRRELLDLETLLVADIAAQWAALPLDDASATRAVISPLAVELVADYGALNAAAGADWYMELRDEAAVASRFTARTYAPLVRGQVEASVGWALAPLYGAMADPAAAQGRLSGALQRLAGDAERATVLGNAERDPQRVRWYRHTRPNCCAFCSMLSGRGAVYRTERSGGFDSHNDCRCFPVPLFTASDRPPSSVDAAADEYDEARQAVLADGGKPTSQAILAKMRVLTGRS